MAWPETFDWTAEGKRIEKYQCTLGLHVSRTRIEIDGIEIESQWDGNSFVVFVVEAPKQRFTREQHIHRCVMINLETSDDELQGRIMDYIIANDDVPPFLLNDVPMYLAGYRKAKSEQHA